MNKKSVIFDMDGVIFDTERLALKFWLQATKDLGYQITKEDVAYIRGRNVNDSIAYFHKRFGEKVDYREGRKLRNEYIKKEIASKGMPIKHGFFKLIEYLRSNGYKIALATSNTKELASFYMEKACIGEDVFDFKIFGDSLEHSKPDPEIFLRSCAGLNTDPKDVFIFEDSPAGIMAGHNAKCDVIVIPDITPLTADILQYPICCCSDMEVAIEFLKYNAKRS